MDDIKCYYQMWAKVQKEEKKTQLHFKIILLKDAKGIHPKYWYSENE